MRAEFSANDVDRLLGGLGAEFIVLEDGATLLRCKLSLDMMEPAHPQSSNAIRDLANAFSGIFVTFRWGFHFEPNDDGSKI